MVHKAALHVIHDERNRDAAPRPKARRPVAHLYQRVQNLVQRLASQRWRQARAQARAGDSAAVPRFRKRWEAPGLAAVLANEANVRVTLFMRDAARMRFMHKQGQKRAHGEDQPKRHRYQQYAPPAQMPAGTVSVYTAGDAVARVKGQPPPPAGYGAVAVQGGWGRNSGGRVLFRIGGVIVAGTTPNVLTTTSYLAELVSFTRALQWALHDIDARASPGLCICYYSEYAANVATGVWRPKKHKLMADEARGAWAALKRARNGRVWIQHVPQTSVHIIEAEVIAKDGRSGIRTYSRHEPSGTTRRAPGVGGPQHPQRSRRPGLGLQHLDLGMGVQPPTGRPGLGLQHLDLGMGVRPPSNLGGVLLTPWGEEG